MARNSGHGLQMKGPLGIVFTTVLIDLIGFGIILPILPLYAQQYGASALQIGFLTASYAFAHTWAFCRQYGYFWSLILPEFARLYMALGLAAVTLLVPLTLTSNAWARQKLGAAWAKLHQLAYAIALLALIHFMLFRAIAPREAWIHAALIAFALVMRFVPRRNQLLAADQSASPRAAANVSRKTG